MKLELTLLATYLLPGCSDSLPVGCSRIYFNEVDSANYCVTSSKHPKKCELNDIQIPNFYFDSLEDITCNDRANQVRTDRGDWLPSDVFGKESNATFKRHLSYGRQEHIRKRKIINKKF